MGLHMAVGSKERVHRSDRSMLHSLDGGKLLLQPHILTSDLL